MAARLTILLTVFLAILVSPAPACTIISATGITTNTTWGLGGIPADSCYVVQNTLTVSGNATLTIQAGTVVRFASGASLVIASSTPGSLIASGTPTAPVVFTSSNELRGGWAGITFQDNSDFGGFFSSLSYSVIRRGGSGGSQIAITNSNGVTLSNCVIAEHQGLGLNLTNASPNATNCTFRDFDQGTYPVSGALPNVAPLFGQNVFVPNPSGCHNAILIKAGSLAQSAALTAPPAGFCYITDGGQINIGLNPNNPVLTVPAGTLMKMKTGSRILVGNGGANAGLSAQGVVFTSAQDDTLGDTDCGGPSQGGPGQWDGITYEGATLVAQSGLDSCIVRYAGNNLGAGVRLNGGDAPVTRCLISNNLGNGLRVIGNAVSAGGVHDNLLRDNGTYEISGSPRPLGNMVLTNTCLPSGNGSFNGYEIVTGTMDRSASLPMPPAGFCYITDGGQINIGLNPNNPVLTIAPGAVMKMKTGSRILVGSGGANGGLFAQDVVFTAARDDTLGDTNGDLVSVPGPGQWDGITFEGATMVAQSGLDHCTVRYAGNSLGAGVRLNGGDAPVTHCLITGNLGNGLRVIGNAVTAAGVHDNLLRDNATYEISASPRPLGNLVLTNTCVPSADGTLNGYEIITGVMDRSANLPTPPLGFCYITDGGNLDIGLEPVDPVLTIAPGSVIKMKTGSRILTGSGGANGGLKAREVVFTSAQDDVSGDTNGDGPSVGAPGQWQGITFESATLRGGGYELICCTIKYAGAGSIGAGVRMNNSFASILNCTVANCLTNGIRVAGNSQPGIYGCLITGNVVGLAVESSASPIVRRCNFVGNSSSGMTNTGTAIVDATSNWWGSATGPLDVSPGPPDYNPAGSGQSVSDNIAYRPWLDAATTPDCGPTVSAPLPDALPRTSLTIVGLRPNPAEGKVSVAFILASAALANLDLIDITGRRVAHRELIGFAPGIHTISVGRSGEVPPGIYLVRLTQDGQARTIKAVVIK